MPYLETRSQNVFAFEYPTVSNPIFDELRQLIQFEFSHEMNSVEKVKMIAGYVHNLFSHDGNCVPSSSNPINIYREATQGKSFRCVEYSILTNALCWAYGVPARIVGLKMKNVETAISGAGHVIIEFWSQPHKKWIMCDVQAGIIPVYEEMPLSAFELGERLRAGSVIDYILVADSGFSLSDKKKYPGWIIDYLYFFDTLLDGSFWFSGDCLESARLEQSSAMLAPVGVQAPKVFQRTTKINAVVSHSVLDFYSSAPKPVSLSFRM